MGTDLFRDKILILDGAMGTVLQQRGLPPGGMPELLNLTDPGLLASVYREYADAGSQVVYANTFGANALKLARSGRSVSEVITAAIQTAREAVEGRALVALDVGPLGELLEPLGSLTFERAYDLFREIMAAGAAAGADLVAIETMTDLYEAKAALLAAKEHTGLPVLVTMSFEESGRTFTGCTAASMARTLEGLGADAIGLNCSLGPNQLAPLLRELCENTRLPVAAKPNAGLPDPVDGHYDLGPEAFAAALAPCLAAGVTIFGGCCGTSPAYIRCLRAALEGARPAPRRFLGGSFVCTPVSPVRLDGVRVIGERVNPTGKKRFQQALLEEDLDYILDVAAAQEEAGADILDVNVGCPGVDEVTMLPRVVKKLQSAVSLPLQLDSSNPDALEAALRVYNGKAAVNSVNGEPEMLARVLPIVKKYGASVVGLTMDRDGIPRTAEKRVEIAERILEAALAHGIPREDVWIDCLALTVSAQQEQTAETLKAVRTVRRELGLQTVLGRVLSGEDAQCRDYIARFAAAPAAAAPAARAGALTLEETVARGLRADAARLAKELLQTEDGLALVEGRLIPALDAVGEGYERGTVFLPQLLSAAQAAQTVFEAVRTSIAEKGGAPVKKGRLIVATVQGDIHDIGKNIVKTVLENYGYEVIDLGRDVPPEAVVQAAADRNVDLVGLSALMTTTLPAMEETVRRLRAMDRPPAVFVGGAVVTQPYAERIGADYARDARQSVEIARRVLG